MMTQGKSNRFAQIVEDLTGRDREKKLWAIAAVGLLKIPEHADILVDLLGSNDDGIISAAIESLGRIGNPRSIKYLLGFIANDHPIFCEKAIAVLPAFELKPVLDAVLKVAGPERPSPIRKKLLGLLGTVKDPRVAETMSEILGQTQDSGLLVEAMNFFIRFPAPEKRDFIRMHAASGQWEVSMAANLALSRIKDETARGQLRKMAKSPAHPIRHALLHGINRSPLIEDRELYEIFLRDINPQIRLAALEGLQLFSAHERAQILLEFLQKEREESVRKELYKRAIHEKSPVFFDEFLKLVSSSSESLKKLGRDGLTEIGAQVLDKIVNHFPKFSLVIKEQMVLVLGAIGDQGVVHLLEANFSSRERWLKLNSIEAIAMMGLKSMAPKFAQMLLQEEDVWIRATLLSALSRICDPRYLPIFLENLKHPDARVRANTIEGLMRVGNESCKQGLEPYLRDPNDRVRVNAAITMWKMGDPAIIDSLKGMLHESTKWMRGSAAFALGEIGDSQATPALLELLNDPEEVVYRNAFEALVKIADVRSLIPILKEREKKRIPDETYLDFLHQLSENLKKK